MNVPASPRLLIFAAILRLIVPIDFGISIPVSSLLHFILTVGWLLNNISFSHKNARKNNNIILTVSIQSKDRDEKGRKKAIANYSPQWPQKTMPVFSANYFSFFVTGNREEGGEGSAGMERVGAPARQFCHASI